MAEKTGRYRSDHRSLGGWEEGQAAFEFLLVLPSFILFLLLLVDLGITMYQYVSVANAVREGARWGAVNCGDGSCDAATIVTRVLDRSGGVLSNAAEVTVSWADRNGNGLNNDKGDSIIVSVNHPYNFLFFPATIPILSCADMRLERKDLGSGLPSPLSECP